MRSDSSVQEMKPFMSPLTVLAFAVGTSVGWGSLVVTSNTYLKQAGPLGSVLGLLIGAAIMILVCWNYHYLANRYPEGTGVYFFTKKVFGYDRAFLISWFVFLLYASIFWANATAVPLFARYIFGDVFRFGYLYTIFGYEIYLGELLLTAAVIGLTVFLMINSKKTIARVMIGLVAIFVVSITVCFIVGIVNFLSGSVGFNPNFAPDSLPIAQVAKIASISPWAFIGFESVMHSSTEFNFPKKQVFGILSLSIIITTALYIFVTLLSVTAYPPEYSSWVEYIDDLGNLSGLKALPAFYATGYYLGDFGIMLLFFALFALIATSLIANLWALCRMMHVIGRDSILSERFTKLNEKGIPAMAILFVGAISLFVLFLGRSAIGWIVDVTTIIAIFLYGFVAAATIKCAKQDNDKKSFAAGLIVLIAMTVFGVFIIVPELHTNALSSETYLLFILWSVFGMIFFHHVISKDRARHFGKAMIVWVAFVSIILLLGIIWMDTIKQETMIKILNAFDAYRDGEAPKEILAMSESDYMGVLVNRLDRTTTNSLMVVLGLFAISIGGFLSNYFSMKKYQNILKDDVEKKNQHIADLQQNFVIGMLTMIESRDNSTGGHINRTSDIVKILAEEMKQDESLGLDDEFYDCIITAAPMHDIGKIAVDDAILRKPGRFTLEEFEIMKTHTTEGARIISQIVESVDNERFKQIAINMAHYHHERFDGSGYPKKLVGEAIPIEARIMAIADVYDALVSKRVYKDKMSFEEAYKIIMDGNGTQFDSRLIVYFERAIPKIEAYYSNL
ncbi:MAG: amino acid permease [Clostridia bacterium]|nr:amino acid permease [Clostridia bacterium]